LRANMHLEKAHFLLRAAKGRRMPSSTPCGVIGWVVGSMDAGSWLHEAMAARGPHARPGSASPPRVCLCHTLLLPLHDDEGKPCHSPSYSSGPHDALAPDVCLCHTPSHLINLKVQACPVSVQPTPFSRSSLPFHCPSPCSSATLTLTHPMP